jgi:hypothetical protein
VARNKATRSRRAQTAARVRNPESGRRRRGKPAQRSPGLKRRRGPNPKGGVVDFPRRVSCTSRTTSVVGQWEAAFGSAEPIEPLRLLDRHTAPGAPRGASRLRPRESNGSFAAENPTSVGRSAAKSHPLSNLGSGSGEARCEPFACAHSLGSARRVESRLRPRPDSARGGSLRATRLRRHHGLAPQ